MNRQKTYIFHRNYLKPTNWYFQFEFLGVLLAIKETDLFSPTRWGKPTIVIKWSDGVFPCKRSGRGPYLQLVPAPILKDLQGYFRFFFAFFSVGFIDTSGGNLLIIESYLCLNTIFPLVEVLVTYNSYPWTRLANWQHRGTSGNRRIDPKSYPSHEKNIKKHRNHYDDQNSSHI